MCVRWLSLRHERERWAGRRGCGVDRRCCVYAHHDTFPRGVSPAYLQQLGPDRESETQKKGVVLLSPPPSRKSSTKKRSETFLGPQSLRVLLLRQLCVYVSSSARFTKSRATRLAKPPSFAWATREKRVNYMLLQYKVLMIYPSSI